MSEIGTDNSKKLALEGLGGWLIPVGIGIVVNPILFLVVIIVIHIPLILNGTLSIVYYSDSTKFFIILYELGVNIAALVYSVFILVLFFTKKKSFPRHYIIFTIYNFVILLVDTIIGNKLWSDGDYTDVARVLVSGAIWCTYMLKSWRVKNTFVN